MSKLLYRDRVVGVAEHRDGALGVDEAEDALRVDKEEPVVEVPGRAAIIWHQQPTTADDRPIDRCALACREGQWAEFWVRTGLPRGGNERDREGEG